MSKIVIIGTPPIGLKAVNIIKEHGSFTCEVPKNKKQTNPFEPDPLVISNINLKEYDSNLDAHKSKFHK